MLAYAKAVTQHAKGVGKLGDSAVLDIFLDGVVRAEEEQHGGPVLVLSIQWCSESKKIYSDSGGGYPGWGRYGKDYRCWKCKRLSDALRIKCYREFREKYSTGLQDQLLLLRRVLTAQSDRGWKAVLKGADLEKGEEGFISLMPFRHYSGRSGVMGALAMGEITG